MRSKATVSYTQLATLLITLCMLWNSDAYASSSGSGGSSNCKFSEPFNQTWKVKYKDILKCYMKGMDPPVNWRPGGSTGTVEGSRGATNSPTSITAWRAPEDPPNSGQSASDSAMNFSNSFPGFPGSSGNGSGGENNKGQTITCPTSQASGGCSCGGVVTIASIISHVCAALTGTCSCIPSTITGLLSGISTTVNGDGNVSGTLTANLSSPSTVTGSFTGSISYTNSRRDTVTGTFTGTMGGDGTVSGIVTGTATPPSVGSISQNIRYADTSFDAITGASKRFTKNNLTASDVPNTPSLIFLASSSSGSTASSEPYEITATVSGSVSTSSKPLDDSRGFCAVEGDRVALIGRSLECGGAIPAPALQNRIVNLMDNPHALGLIDANQYWFYYYEKDMSAKRYSHIKTYQIPTFLCRMENVCDSSGVCKMQKVKDIDIPPPLAQTFSYNRSLDTLYIKLKTTQGDPLTLEEEFTTRNKVLRVPIVGNRPYVPKDDENDDGDLEECDLTADYYVDEPDNTEFLSMVPFFEQDCNRGQFFLPDSCSPKILMFDKDNPTMIAPQNSTVTFYPVEGRNEVMASSSLDGQLMIRYPSLIRLGGTGTYYFPDGVVGKFIGDPRITQDNLYLWVLPPAALQANSTQVTFPNSGWIQNVGGEHIADYANRATANVNWGAPLYVMPQGVMGLRSTMDYPTYRNGYIRLPISPPAE
jgi:hypothetical protein